MVLWQGEQDVSLYAFYELEHMTRSTWTGLEKSEENNADDCVQDGHHEDRDAECLDNGFAVGGADVFLVFRMGEREYHL